MKKFLLFFILLFCYANSEAQSIPPPLDLNEPVMTFDSLTQNFCDVKPGTQVLENFYFKNTGKSPLIITGARGSGGTVADYPKEPIAPGNKGVIVIRFCTDGKMGLQDKTTTIESNNRDGNIVLHIKGNITTGPFALIRFDSTSISFGKVEQGTLIVKEFHFTNAGKANLIIRNVVFGHGANYAEWPKNEIPPGESGVIKITQTTSDRTGPLSKSIDIQSNSENGSVQLQLTGWVYAVQYMKFDSTTYHFEKVKQGEYVRLEIPFTNTGTTPIQITDCVTACGCDVAEAPREPIPPGGKGVIKYLLNTDARRGVQHKQIIIRYNNDQVVVLNIIGEVTPPYKPD